MNNYSGTYFPPLIEPEKKPDTLPIVPNNIVPVENSEKPIDFEKKNEACSYCSILC